MDVKIKRLSETAVIPTYAKPGDAGMDLTAVSYEYDDEKNCHIYGTGLAIEIPEGHVGLLFPRSSIRKTNVFLTNHVGVIDSGYRGEIMFSFKDRDNIKGTIPVLVRPYEIGDRIGQIIIMPYPQIDFVEVEELSETERGTGGHGSTGN